MQQALEEENLLKILTGRNNLASVVYDMGDVDLARRHWEQVAMQAQEAGLARYSASALCNLGELAYDEEDYAHALAYMEARLLAFANHARSVGGTPREPNEAKQFAACVAAAHATLTEQEYKEAWTAGLAMKPEQAVLYALEPL